MVDKMLSRGDDVITRYRYPTCVAVLKAFGCDFRQKDPCTAWNCEGWYFKEMFVGFYADNACQRLLRTLFALENESLLSEGLSGLLKVNRDQLEELSR